MLGRVRDEYGIRDGQGRDFEIFSAGVGSRIHWKIRFRRRKEKRNQR